MTHVLDVVKRGLRSTSNRSFAKRPLLVTVWAVPMTVARVLKSRMTVTCHVRFGSSGGLSDGPADCNLGGLPVLPEPLLPKPSTLQTYPTLTRHKAGKLL